jgi:hypothetical protein
MPIRLYHPIPLAGRTLVDVELRPPGRRVVEAMAAVRLANGFTNSQAIKFIARLSGHGESTIRRLSDEDIANLKGVLEGQYAAERRRLIARSAVASAAKAAEGGSE